MLGGLGVCGKQFCCSQFLNEFHPVSIKMAKTQGLSLNPTKISGSCGRLMCCLKYEENAYEDLVKKAPKIGAFVETPSGKGSVINVNLLRGNAKVRLEDGYDTTLKSFTFDELDVLGGKGRRAEYITARDEGRLEEAGFKQSPPPVLVRSLDPSLTTIDNGHSPASGDTSDRSRPEKKQQPQRRKNKGEHKGEHKHRDNRDKSVQAAGKETSTHPQPLEGAKKKKPHHKRRRGRGGGGQNKQGS